MGSCASVTPSEVDTFDQNVVGLDHFEIQRTLGKGGFGKVNAVIKKSKPMRDEWFALKTMQKVLLVRSKKWTRLRQNIFAERNILAEIKHPFICNSYYAFQDESNLYLVMDLALGGDLRYQLKCTTGGFSEKQSRFYIAQLILALEKLHGEHIIHQDIKPENLLMDGQGYIKLSDFGLSRRIERKHCYEGAGTRGYIPTEVYREKNHRHTFSADWFAVGVTCYEFLKKCKPYKYTTIQKMPYESQNRSERLKTRVSSHRFPEKDCISTECKIFVQGLILANPDFRLGAKGVQEVKDHPWFLGFDWESLFEKTYPEVPFIPDTSKANCEGVYDVRDCLGADDSSMKLPLSKQDLFKGYEYNVCLSPEPEASHPKPVRRESNIPPHLAKALSEAGGNRHSATSQLSGTSDMMNALSGESIFFNDPSRRGVTDEASSGALVLSGNGCRASRVNQLRTKGSGDPDSSQDTTGNTMELTEGTATETTPAGGGLHGVDARSQMEKRQRCGSSSGERHPEAGERMSMSRLRVKSDRTLSPDEVGGELMEEEDSRSKRDDDYIDDNDEEPSNQRDSRDI